MTARVGVVSRAGARDEQIAEIVAAAEHAAAEASPAEDAQPLVDSSPVAGTGWDAGPGRPRICGGRRRSVTAGTRAPAQAGEVNGAALSWSEKAPTPVTTEPGSKVPVASNIGAPQPVIAT